MPAIEEVSPDVEKLADNVKNLGMNSENGQHNSDNESDDEFHDACDRASESGANTEEKEEFTEAETLELISSGEASKSEGNKLYLDEHWEAAKQCYVHGLTRAPKRKPAPASAPPVLDREEDENETTNVPKPTPAVPLPTELEQRAASLRAQLNCNIGACCVKLNDHEGSVKACTEALLDDPKYAKALQRRAASNEIIGTWSALSSAESDYTALLDILPPSTQPPVRRALARVKPRAEEAKQRETAEMMGKLKDLGNNLLGRFGLSTDNFQFTPNGQGGYGLNFVR